MISGAGAVLLFTTALLIRLPWLWEVPRYIDELKEVRIGFLIFLGKALPLHNAAFDIGALHNYILAGVFKLLGPGVYWPRLYVAVTSALTVVLVYYLGKRLYGRTTAIIAAGLLLTNGMHILVTHMAWANCTTPFFWTMAVIAMVLAEQEKDGRWLVVAGLMWGITLQTHSTVAIYILAAFIYIVSRHFRRTSEIKPGFYIGSFAAFLAGYANMVYFNILTRGGSLQGILSKGYTLEEHPGLASFTNNLLSMAVELLRTLSSDYKDHPQVWWYLLNPIFLISAFLLGLGIYFAVKEEKGLPAYMMVAGFALIPWVNRRYGFFVVTRYIMPIVLSGILLLGFGASRILQMGLEKFKQQRIVLSSSIAVFLLFLTFQLAVFYNYCDAMENTDMSNRLSLNLIKTATHLVRPQMPVLLDRQLHLENDPLPYLFAIERQHYEPLPARFRTRHRQDDLAKWLGAIVQRPSWERVAIVSERTFFYLHKAVSMKKVLRFRLREALHFKDFHHWQTVYIVIFTKPGSKLVASIQQRKSVNGITGDW